MIEINLLPEDRRPVERTPLPRFLLIVGGVVGFCLEVVVLVMFALGFPDMRRTKENLTVTQGRIRKLSLQVDGIQKEIARVRERGDTIQKVIKDRRVWAPILYRLSAPEVLPAAIWFKQVKLEAVRVRGARGGATETMSLVLDGYARGPDSSTMNQEVSAFQRNLKDNLCERFPDDFEGSVELTNVQLKKLPGGRDVPETAPKEAVTFTMKMPLKAPGAGKAKKK